MAVISLVMLANGLIWWAFRSTTTWSCV